MQGKQKVLGDLFKTREAQVQCRDCEFKIHEGQTTPGFVLESAFLPELPEKTDVYFVPYNIGRKRYEIMRKLEVKWSPNESIAQLLEFCRITYNIGEEDQYVVASVANDEIIRVHPRHEHWREAKGSIEAPLAHAKIFIYQKPEFDLEETKSGEDLKMVVLNFAYWVIDSDTGESIRKTLPPRLIWVYEDE